MKKDPEVTIILPNYNSYRFIENTIKSILNQSYTNWKLFIIDDCSKDKTRKVLKKYTQKKKIKERDIVEILRLKNQVQNF